MRTERKLETGEDGKMIWRIYLIDTEKNLSYVEKRKQLAELATAELGITCFG